MTAYMRRGLAFLLIILLTVPAGETQTKSSKPRQSLHYSCLDKPFLSVSAYAAGHTSFPDVGLRLIDPLGRSSGNDSEEKPIPNNQYGPVIEIPKHATRSKAIAIEVCDSMQGDYLVIVSEHDKQEYGLAISAHDGGAGNEAIGSTFHSRGDRACKLQFRFLMRDHTVTLRWMRDQVQVADPNPICDLPQTDHSR
jgi:hypothetical protein